ncbi:MAG: PAS domain S-box protein [Magnetococcus sp. YQC-3]
MTPSQNHNRLPRHRLGRRVVLHILLFSFLMTLIGTSLHLYQDFLAERAAVDARLRYVETSHLPLINRDIWLTRNDAVALQLAGIVHLPHVHHARVTLADGEEIFQGEKTGNHLILRTFALEGDFDGRMLHLGNLEIGISLEAIYASLWAQGLTILTTWAVATLLVSLFILSLLHAMVGRRIQEMANYARMIRLKRLEELELLPCRPVTEGAMDELDHLAMALNQMVSELRVAYAQAQTLSLSICRERDRAAQYLDLVGGIIVEIDQEERITLINQAGCSLLGYEQMADLLGKNWFDTLLPKESRDNLRRMFHEGLTGKITNLPPVIENPVLHRDGSQRHILWRNVLLDAEQGSGKRSLSHGIDITQRKQAEQLLSANRELLNAIISNTQAVIFIKDLQGRFLLVNRQFERLFNIAETEAIGKPLHALLPAAVAEMLSANDRLALESGSVELEERIPLPDGGWRDYLALKFCLWDAQGQPSAICSMATDITELKRIQANLQRESSLNLALQRLSHLLITPDYSISDIARRLLTLARELTGSAHGCVSEINGDGVENIVSTIHDMTAACHAARQTDGSSQTSDAAYPGLRRYALHLGSGFFSNDPPPPIRHSGEDTQRDIFRCCAFWPCPFCSTVGQPDRSSWSTPPRIIPRRIWMPSPIWVKFMPWPFGKSRPWKRNGRWNCGCTMPKSWRPSVPWRRVSPTILTIFSPSSWAMQSMASWPAERIKR